MMEAFELIVLLSAIGSSLLFAVASHGFRSARHAPGQPANPRMRVSVIIAAHDERVHIAATIAALAAQDYPRDRWETVIADDRSSDDTAGIARAAAGGQLDLRIVRIDEVPDGRSPKKHAMISAIERSSGDVLLFTDADCRPGPGWISSMTARFELGASAVIGLAPLRFESSAGRFAAFDAARTAFLSIGFAGLGAPYMAVGRNWACTREAFERAAGFGETVQVLGGDDDLLLQRLSRNGERILACTDRGSLCVSDAPPGWPALLRRRLRHLSVTTRYRGKGAAIIAALSMMETAAVIGGVVLLVHPVSVAAPLIGVLLYAKLLYDMRFLRPVLRLFRESSPLPHPALLAFHEFLHVVSSTVIGITSLFRRPRW